MYAYLPYEQLLKFIRQPRMIKCVMHSLKHSKARSMTNQKGKSCRKVNRYNSSFEPKASLKQPPDTGRIPWLPLTPRIGTDA
jgi:hypothetical protein